MSHTLTPVTPARTLLTLNDPPSQEDAAPVTLGYTLDQMPVVVWPRGDDPLRARTIGRYAERAATSRLSL